MLDMVKERLQSFGYEIQDGDEIILNFFYSEGGKHYQE